jgi:hypothetical protein
MQHIINLNGVIMEILYKHLNCGNLKQINEEIIDFIKSYKFEKELFWNPVDVLEFMKATPRFTTWYLDNNLPIKTVAITRGLHANCCTVHTDTPPSRYKLSWPVLNTEYTWNRWFKVLPGASTEINHLGGTSYLDYDHLVEIDRMRVDRPAIIATGIPHDVWFEPDAVFPRWGLQCQLFLEPDHL